MKSETLSPEVLEQHRLTLAENLRQNPADKKAAKAYAQFMRRYVLPEMKAETKPYSFQEYFALALSQATRALEEGNYAIGAVYVYRASGIEYVIGGRNRTLSEGRSSPHAEQDAIRKAEDVDHGITIDRKSILSKRIAPHERVEKILITSLEPCPRCYGILTAHNPNEVWIATPDPNGAMLDGRQQMLPGIWATRTQRRGIKVVTPSEDSQSLEYINPKYRGIALEMFGTTQQHIDKNIHGMNETPDKFLQTARRSARRIVRRVF